MFLQTPRVIAGSHLLALNTLLRQLMSGGLFGAFFWHFTGYCAATLYVSMGTTRYPKGKRKGQNYNDEYFVRYHRLDNEDVLQHILQQLYPYLVYFRACYAGGAFALRHQATKVFR